MGLAGIGSSQLHEAAHTTNTNTNMNSYESLLNQAINYINQNGRTEETINDLNVILPSAWAANIIADALDQTA